MRVVSVIERSYGSLFAVKFEGYDKDSLEIIQEQWSSVLYLRSFFKQYQKDYLSFYPKVKINQMVIKAIDDADCLFEKLFDLANDNSGASLADFFKPLDNKEEEISYELQALKAYGVQSYSFLRIYAVKFGQSFVITGGAIKLTRRMKDRPHTKLELQKLEWVKEYLSGGHEAAFVYLDIKGDE
ncbi:hypothetical protein KIH41_16005 [Litoribacter ruber]|uniref:hypothetical protein n=1 Tax=Litoribacter ruber TaxID=702568 RepID=UPI001BD9F792|nr:hypothetical protein [Litoribacter ruber]MBT0812791.1 hypothetical protein [Litoribacter ruber]